MIVAELVSLTQCSGQPRCSSLGLPLMVYTVAAMVSAITSPPKKEGKRSVPATNTSFYQLRHPQLTLVLFLASFGSNVLAPSFKGI